MSDRTPPPDDDDLTFLRAMHGMGTQKQSQPERATRVEDTRPDTSFDGIADAEDALFADYMEAVAEGREPALPARKEGDCDEATDAAVGATPDPDCGKPEDDGSALHGAARTLRRRLKKGEIRPTAEIDLHGQHKEQALNSLGAFLQRSQQTGHEVVLVITGRGLHSKELGVLREMVPTARPAPLARSGPPVPARSPPPGRRGSLRGAVAKSVGSVLEFRLAWIPHQSPRARARARARDEGSSLPELAIGVRLRGVERLERPRESPAYEPLTSCTCTSTCTGPWGLSTEAHGGSTRSANPPCRAYRQFVMNGARMSPRSE